MKILSFILIFMFCFAASALTQQESLLIDNFEGPINGGPNGTIDFGAEGDSTISVCGDTRITYSGKQSLKVTYVSGAGGYIWVARGFGLRAANAGWLITPENIDWTEYNAISFYMYGNNTRTPLAFDIKDQSGEVWRYIVNINFTGWRRIVCSFAGFKLRKERQPQTADNNGRMDFPITSYQFEPLPKAEGTLYFDQVEVVKE